MQKTHKKVLMLYVSGPVGADTNFQFKKGFFYSNLKNNPYLCQYQQQNYLVTPLQENNKRIAYKTEQFSQIKDSAEMDLKSITQIAQCIYSNYQKYDAFIVISGFDTIINAATILSFMLQNLSKTIIFTGGFLPIIFLRTDVVVNLMNTFALLTLFDSFNDVIIVCRDKAFRANRCIKFKEKDFEAINSYNLSPLVSFDIQISSLPKLFLPKPILPFNIFTNINSTVGIIKLHLLSSLNALTYELQNPYIKGYVIESFSSGAFPKNQSLWNIFKAAHERDKKIFVSVSQDVAKFNMSLMKEQLLHAHIHYGGDMTTQAALAKLAYLLGKYPIKQIPQYFEKSLRGEITLKDYSIKPLLGLLKEEKVLFYSSIQNRVCTMAVQNFTPSQFIKLFQSENDVENCIQRNNLIHKTVQANNIQLLKYFISIESNINKQDDNNCSPLFYALSNKKSSCLQTLIQNGGKLKCPINELFQLFCDRLAQKDNAFFSYLLKNLQSIYGQHLFNVINLQKRKIIDIAKAMKINLPCFIETL